MYQTAIANVYHLIAVIHSLKHDYWQTNFFISRKTPLLLEMQCCYQENTAMAEKTLWLLSCRGAAFETSCAMWLMSRVPMFHASFLVKEMQNLFFIRVSCQYLW